MRGTFSNPRTKDARRHRLTVATYPRNRDRGVGCQTQHLRRFRSPFEFRRDPLLPLRRSRQGLQRRIATLPVGEPRDPDEDAFAFAHRQARKVVLTRLGLEHRCDLDAAACQRRSQLLLEKRWKRIRCGVGERVHRYHDEPGILTGARTDRVVLDAAELDAAVLRGRTQQQHVVGVGEIRIRFIAPCLPDRAAVERFERFRARWHVAESAQPDEAVRIVEVAELADHGHAGRFERVEELLFEQARERVEATGMQRVLAQFDDRAATRVVKARGKLVSVQACSLRRQDLCLHQCGKQRRAGTAKDLPPGWGLRTP